MQEITSLKQWEELLKKSEGESITVFKHNNRRPASAAAYGKIQQGIDSGKIKETVYLVVIQDHPDISRTIANSLNIKHESPQIITIKNRQAVYDASYSDITVDDLIKFADAKNYSPAGGEAKAKVAVQAEKNTMSESTEKNIDNTL